MCLSKNFEPHVSRVLEEMLKPGHTFVDIGANVGCHTIHAAHLVGDSGKILAVEPLPENIAELKRNIEKYGLKNVEILPYAA